MTALIKLLAFVLAVASVPARATVAGMAVNVPAVVVIVLVCAAAAALWLVARYVHRYPLRPATWRYA